jgi:hypothetical protein
MAPHHHHTAAPGSNARMASAEEPIRIRIRFLGHCELMELEYVGKVPSSADFTIGKTPAVGTSEGVQWQVFGNPWKYEDKVYDLRFDQRSAHHPGDHRQLAARRMTGAPDIRCLGYVVHRYTEANGWLAEDAVLDEDNCRIANLHRDTWHDKPRMEAIKTLVQLNIPKQDAMAIYSKRSQGDFLTWEIKHEDLPKVFSIISKALSDCLRPDDPSLARLLKEFHHQLYNGSIMDLELRIDGNYWLHWAPMPNEFALTHDKECRLDVVDVVWEGGDFTAIDVGHVCQCVIESDEEDEEDDEYVNDDEHAEEVDDQDDAHMLFDLAPGRLRFFLFKPRLGQDNTSENNKYRTHGELTLLSDIFPASKTLLQPSVEATVTSMFSH